MRSRTGAGALALALLLAGAVPPGRAAGAVPPGRAAGAVPPGRAAGAVPRPGPSALLASVPAEPGAVPDAELDATIHHEQLRLVTANATRAVTADENTEGTDRATLGRDEQTYDQDRSTSGAADALLASQRRATGAEAATLRSARDRRAAAQAAVAGDVGRLRTLALGWYVGGAATPPPDAVGDLAGLEAASSADAELEVITDDVEATDRQDLADAADAGRAAGRAAGALTRDRRQEATLRTTSAERAEALLAAGSEMEHARAALAGATSALAGARAAQASAVRDFDGPEGSSTDPTPTILGGSALSASQLAAWFRDSGYEAATSVPIGRLASWYVSQGSAEGVRGDIAFAQAVVETGGFDSPDAIEENNYAGIGHCDSCRSGRHFPSALAGVQGQLRLLHAFATGDGCPTWNSLTGTWATDPDYGLTVLDLYQEILASTLTAAS